MSGLTTEELIERMKIVRGNLDRALSKGSYGRAATEAEQLRSILIKISEAASSKAS